MKSYVVATAGHVDHGKSTLIRALTGAEPDRWQEERRRGLTIDLGFAWTTLPNGAQVGFVDVPGHRRFVSNMLAGLGPAPAVLFVVAADAGWQAQSSEHRDAVVALGIDTGIVALTRTDCASSEQLKRSHTQIAAELANTSLCDVPVVEVSGVTGAGLKDLVTALTRVLEGCPPPTVRRLRLWVDRSFSVAGSGTVVTGTLGCGAIRVGDDVEALGGAKPRRARVRRLECEGAPRELVEPVTRVALNLRGVAAADVARGTALVTPGRWLETALVDVRCIGEPDYAMPADVQLHIGTATLAARVRPLDADFFRVRLARPQPLAVGDRVVLRNPGDGRIAGAVVLDTDPPSLNRRGDAVRRASELRAALQIGDVAAEVRRRRAVPIARLRLAGLLDKVSDTVPAGIIASSGWWIDADACATWASALLEAVNDHHTRDPLAPGLAHSTACQLVDIPDEQLVDLVVREAGLRSVNGYISSADRLAHLGDAENAIATLEARLSRDPFDVPQAQELRSLGLGARELAAAARIGRVLRLPGDVVLLPTAPALALNQLARLSQPFTTSEARLALRTSRRVAIPVLEYLDAQGWTRREGNARVLVVGLENSGREFFDQREVGAAPGIEAADDVGGK